MVIEYQYFRDVAFYDCCTASDSMNPFGFITKSVSLPEEQAQHGAWSRKQSPCVQCLLIWIHGNERPSAKQQGFCFCF
jgi:hypothetical protein